MKKVAYLVAGLLIVAFVVWVVRQRMTQPETRSRKVAFDNVYNGATTLRVHARVDDGPEQSATATCDAKSCTFLLPMADGVHQLTLAVEQNGVRGQSARFTLDTSTVP